MDDADLAQARLEAEQELVRRHAAAHASKPGLPACLECDEPISELRQKLGACRCLACQSRAERLSRRFS